MSVELQDVAWIIVGFCVWATVDYHIVKYTTWRKANKPKPHGATAL